MRSFGCAWAEIPLSTPSTISMDRCPSGLPVFTQWSKRRCTSPTRSSRMSWSLRKGVKCTRTLCSRERAVLLEGGSRAKVDDGFQAG